MNAISTQLDPERIYKTAGKVADRVQEMVTSMDLGTGLKDLATEILDLANPDRIPKDKWERLDQPGFHFVVALLPLLVLGVLYLVFLQPTNTAPVEPFSFIESFQIAEPILGTVFFLLTITIFAWGSIGLLRRNTALNKLHELRSVAHVIHSHQLKKSIRTEKQPATEDSLTLDQLNAYVACCSDLLAVVAKLAALKAQDVNNSVVLDASDRIERLAHDLSDDMWRKVTSAERSHFAAMGD